MTDQQQHPIIVPVKELKKLWREQAPLVDREEWLIERAAQWGCVQRGEVNEAQLQQARDQELEATLAEVSFLNGQALADRIRAARRPMLLARAEIALEQYDRCVSILKEKGYSPAGCIRDALVHLKKLEDSND